MRGGDGGAGVGSAQVASAPCADDGDAGVALGIAVDVGLAGGDAAQEILEGDDAAQDEGGDEGQDPKECDHRCVMG